MKFTRTSSDTLPLDSIFHHLSSDTSIVFQCIQKGEPHEDTSHRAQLSNDTYSLRMPATKRKRAKSDDDFVPPSPGGSQKEEAPVVEDSKSKPTRSFGNKAKQGADGTALPESDNLETSRDPANVKMRVVETKDLVFDPNNMDLTCPHLNCKASPCHDSYMLNMWRAQLQSLVPVTPYHAPHYDRKIRNSKYIKQGSRPQVMRECYCVKCRGIEVVSTRAAVIAVTDVSEQSSHHGNLASSNMC